MIGSLAAPTKMRWAALTPGPVLRAMPSLPPRGTAARPLSRRSSRLGGSSAPTAVAAASSEGSGSQPFSSGGPAPEEPAPLRTALKAIVQLGRPLLISTGLFLAWWLGAGQPAAAPVMLALLLLGGWAALPLAWQHADSFSWGYMQLDCSMRQPAAAMREQHLKYSGLLAICALQARLLFGVFLPASLLPAALLPPHLLTAPLVKAPLELFSTAAQVCWALLTFTSFFTWWQRRLFFAAAEIRRSRNRARRGATPSGAEQPGRP